MKLTPSPGTPTGWLGILVSLTLSGVASWHIGSLARFLY